MDVLKENWSPVWELRSCCLAVGALLESPEEGSPLNVDAGVFCFLSLPFGKGDG